MICRNFHTDLLWWQHSCWHQYPSAHSLPMLENHDLSMLIYGIGCMSTNLFLQTYVVTWSYLHEYMLHMYTYPQPLVVALLICPVGSRLFWWDMIVNDLPARSSNWKRYLLMKTTVFQINTAYIWTVERVTTSVIVQKEGCCPATGWIILYMRLYHH